MPLLFSDSHSTRAKDLLIGHHSKPLSAVTDWVDRICDPNRSLSETDINGFIIELVEAINLQPTGPEEASRAIRKQLKHGRISQQKKSLMVLDALVLNGGDRFRTTFADGRLVECIKAIVLDPRTDQLVRRRTMVLLSDWERAYSAEPKMAVVAGLYKACGGKDRLGKLSPQSDSSLMRTMITGIEQSYITQEPAKAKSKAKAKAKEEQKKKKKLRGSTSIDLRYRHDLVLPESARPSFDLTLERPQILQAVATASQCANNLVNCLQLIDHDKTDIETDAKVQILLEKIKVAQKVLVRYIRAVTEKDEEGEYIGTLLNTNGQVIAALEVYELLSQPKREDVNVGRLTAQLRDATVSTEAEAEERNLFDDPGTPLTSPEHCKATPKDDLLGLDFSTAPLDSIPSLPAPIVPVPVGNNRGTRGQATEFELGTLSDYSDYESEESDRPGTSSLLEQGSLSPSNPYFNLIKPTATGDAARPTGPSTIDHRQDVDPFADPTLA